MLDLREEQGQIIWQSIETDQKPGSDKERQLLRERLGWPMETTVAIFTGQLYHIKGVDILFEAMRRQPDDRLRLTILGTGILETSLREACRSNPALGRRIYLGGFQHNVFEFLRGADIFVLPSRQEGASTSLLEALSIGLCAVGSDVGGIHDILTAGDCGVLVPAEDPDALANAMRDLMNNPARRLELGRQGREFVRQNCRAEDMANSYIDVFFDLANSSEAVQNKTA